MIPAQCRAARALLDWSRAELARSAGLTEVDVDECEREGGRPSAQVVRSLRRALESGGVTFTADQGPGVRLARSGPRDEGLRPDQLSSENDG